MKKSLIGLLILNNNYKFNNGTLRFIRLISENSFDMQQQQQKKHQGQQYFKKRSSMQQQQESSREDILSNLRKWIKTGVTEKQGQIFTVLNYNILSQKLLEMHKYLYNHHEKDSLNWDIRLHNVVGEVFKSNPSILCCQVS